METLLLGILFSLQNIQKQIDILKVNSVQAQEITFADLPIFLQEIALCESRGLQSARGKLGEIGIFQIRPEVWGKKAKEFGLNLKNANDNMEMALWIWSQQGSRPWLGSKRCHGY